jgi:hypothetical protein
MSVDLTKLVNLQGLVKFKQRQDTQNSDTYVSFADIFNSYNNTVSIPMGTKNTVVAVLTEGSSINAANLTGTVANGVTVPASTIDGVLDISNIPAAALERVVTVADQSARFALSTSDVQLGDVVKQTDTGKMYFVVDTANLNSASGYMEFVAGAAAEVPWTGVTGKPNFGTGANDFAIGNHVHGSISNDGKIGSTANLPVITGTDGLVTTGSFGTAANTFAEGNHTHGNISNDGKVGSTADLPLITGTAGAVSAGICATGANATSATAFVNGADARLSDARDPNDHASNKVTLMTGYAKGSAASAIATTDSLNAAIGKLEYKVDNVATDAEIDEEIFGIVA